MSKLEKGLKEWASLGLITQDQAKLIREHEAAKPESSWVLSGSLILGAVIVGIGVISLIAANWDGIPDALKLAGDFALLGGLALAILRSWDSKREILFETLLVFFLIICLASIGLISQVYHTSGALYQALLLWSGITFFAALAARRIFVPTMWTGAFLSGIFFAAMEEPALQSLFQKNSYAAFMAMPLLCAAMTVVSKSLAGECASTRAFRHWTLYSGITALMMAEISFFPHLFDNPIIGYVPGYLLATLVGFGIWQSLEYRRIQKWILIAALGSFMMALHLPVLDFRSPIIYAAFTIIVLGSMAFYVASLKERRWFQWFLSALGLRFLVLYFQAFGGLAMTGFGLILSGGFVIGMATLWNKYRKPIEAWAERSAQ